MEHSVKRLVCLKDGVVLHLFVHVFEFNHCFTKTAHINLNYNFYVAMGFWGFGYVWFVFGFLVFDSSFVHLVSVFVFTSVFVSTLTSIFYYVSIRFGF